MPARSEGTHKTSAARIWAKASLMRCRAKATCGFWPLVIASAVAKSIG
jgi:hypothetical protein